MPERAGRFAVAARAQIKQNVRRVNRERRAAKGVKIREGLVIAIEPMVNMGGREVYTGNDEWTVFTKDGKPSAHYEHTVAVKKDGPDVLTTFEFIEEVVYGVAV